LLSGPLVISGRARELEDLALHLLFHRKLDFSQVVEAGGSDRNRHLAERET
jgi:hypothetical protein